MLIGCYRLNGGIWERYNVISRAQSTIWNKRFYEVGSFQIRLQSTDVQVYDIITHGENAGVVLKVKKTYEYQEIYGYDLKGLTSFRVAEAETLSADSNAEEKFKAWVKTCLKTGDRTIEGLTITPVHQYENMIPAGELEECKLSKRLEEISKAVSLGWDITFDSSQKKLVFDCYAPQRKTELVFSKKYKNIQSAEYIVDAYDTVDSSLTGIERREGSEDKATSEYMTAEANERLVYGIDYKLGDIVTVEEFGQSAELQITELEFVYEQNKTIITPTFGEAKQNIIKKLIKEANKNG